MNAARLLRVLFLVIVVVPACGGAPKPAAVSSSDTCAYCRMVVSDARFAAQAIGAGEEPRFFDDIGCLAAFVRQTPPPADAAVYVADHRTGAWIPSTTAVYSRVESLATPMGSHLIAHADDASRRADPAAAGGTVLTAADVFAAPARGSTP